MAVRPDLVPLDVVKGWSKRLVKAWPEANPGAPRPTLAICQEALARVLGHPNWHQLTTAYPLPTQPLSSCIGRPSAPFAELMGLLHSNPLAELMSLFQQAITQGIPTLHMVCDRQHATVTGNIQGNTTVLREMSANTLHTLLRSFYDTQMDNHDISFHPESIQSGFARQTLNGEAYHLLYRSIPLTDGFRASIDLLPVGQADPIAKESLSLGMQALTAAQGGLFLLAVPQLHERQAFLVSLTMAWAAQGKQVVVLSHNPLPQLDGVSGVSVSPISGAPDALARLLRAVTRLPHDVIIINHAFSFSEDWNAIEATHHTTHPCFVMTEDERAKDALVRLDRLDRLEPWLRYGWLRGVATVSAGTGQPVAKRVVFHPTSRRVSFEPGALPWETCLGEGTPV